MYILVKDHRSQSYQGHKGHSPFNKVAEISDNLSIKVKKAKNIKATEAKDIEVTEARDIEFGKVIEVPEVTEFFESLEPSAKPHIDSLRKEQKKYFCQNSIFSTSQQT